MSTLCKNLVYHINTNIYFVYKTFVSEAPIEYIEVMSEWLLNKTLFLLELEAISKLATCSRNKSGVLLRGCAPMLTMA